MARVRGIKQPHPLGSVASRSGVSLLTAESGGATSHGGVKISALPAASAANDIDQLEVNQGGVSRRVTVGQVIDAMDFGITGITSPLDFGASGDGVTNDTAAFQAAVDAAAGGTVFVPAGRYAVSQTITSSVGLDLRMADGAVIDISTAPSATTAFSVSGSIASALPLTANAVAGATTIPLSAPNAATLAVGDYIKISSGAIYDPGRTDSPIGEIVRVAGVSGTTVTLAWALVGSAYNTADTAVAAKITFIERCNISGGRIVGGGPGLLHKGVKFNLCHTPTVDGLHVQATEDVGLWFVDCIYGSATRCHLADCTFSNSGYGVNVSSCVQDTTIDNCTMTGCRHAFTTSTSSGVPGLSRRVTVSNCHVSKSVSTGDALDTHTPTENISFIGNTVLSATASGINIECPSATVIGNTIISPTLNGIIFINPTLYPTNYLCEGNRVKFSGAMGIRYGSTGPGLGVGSNIEAVKIDGNTVVQSTGRSIYVVSDDTWRIHSTSISNNIIRSPLDATAVINMTKADDCVCSGNIVTDAPSTSAVFRINDVTRTVIIGNVARGASISTNRGVSVTSGTDILVANNVLSNFSTGIIFDNASSLFTIRDNRLPGCSILVAPGTSSFPDVEGTNTRALSFITTDADLTLTVYVSTENHIHSGTLTANRLITLSTTNAWIGARFRITRTGAGAFNLDVGGLKNLTTGQWCDVTYNGSVWALVAFGSL